MNLTKQEKRNNFFALLFFFSTVVLWMCGLFSQLLLVLMRHHPDFLSYLLSLVPVSLILLLFYTSVVWYPDGKDWFKSLAEVLLIAALAWSLYLLRTAVNVQLDNAVLEPPWNNLFAPAEQDTLNAVREDCKFHTILILCNHYGSRIRTLYTVITAVWCVIAVLASFQVYRWWEKCSYFFCFFLILLQLLLPVLEAHDIINCRISYPFSANWIFNCTLIAPQLGVMFGLIKISRPRGPLLMVPGDDFWREIVD